MKARESAGKRKAGQPANAEQKPKLRLLKPQSESSTPDSASELVQELKAALRKLSRKRKDGADDDSPEAA